MESPIMLEEHNIVISAELLRFLEWLCEHEQDTLKKLITKALHSPHHELSLQKTTVDDIKDQVVHFFSLLDALLQEANLEKSAQEDFNHILVPAINKVDITQCTADTIAKSLDKLTSTPGIKTTPEAKEIFCKALLKNWSPSNDKQTVN
jgi:hypothetical protein